jgi:hypothetical protein
MENTYSRIIQCTQVTKHPSLYAWEFTRAVTKIKKNPDDYLDKWSQQYAHLEAINFTMIKQIVAEDFIRMEAHKKSDTTVFMPLHKNEEKRMKDQFTIYQPLQLAEGDTPGVFVPAGTALSQIINSAGCRVGGRFPVLTYLHKHSGRGLWRASELRLESFSQNNETLLNDDVAVISKIIRDAKKLLIYTSRENSKGELKQYGFE